MNLECSEDLMRPIHQACAHIQTFPGIWMDRGLRQFTNPTLQNQLQERSDGFRRWLNPYNITLDFQCFFEWYAGFVINTRNYIWAVGSQYALGINVPFVNGFLQVSHLEGIMSKEEGGYIEIFLDLGGVIAQDSVIGIPSWAPQPSEIAVVSNPEQHQDSWILMASSFTEWLELGAATGGTFGYFLPPMADAGD
ncbi:MAG: hypothetical protein MUD01_18330 [Chloroflexaceae bacterium]|nr:hypothetical protein [Chloroflexaceae bacterium]